MSKLSYREEEGRELLRLLYENPDVPVAVDTEGTGLHPEDPGGSDYCIGISIACVIDDAPYKHYFANAHPTGVNCQASTIEQLEYVLTQQGRLLIFCNVQYDMLSLETISETKYDDLDFIDIITMAHLCDENRPYNKGLDSLSLHYLEEPGKIVDLFVEKEKKSGNQNITPEQMWDYAVLDAVTTWRVWFHLLDNKAWQDLPENIWPDKQEFIRVLIEMKRRGALIDADLATEMIDVGESKLKELAAELGYPAISKKPTRMYPNPDPDPLPVLGPKALTEIFLERLGLPIIKVSKKTGKPSFDREVMEEYDMILERIESPEAALVQQYRGWQKAVSAAYKPYVRLAGTDGRVRCSYKPHGTVTGRLSSSEPNMQQIPKVSDKEWNGKVKECIISKPGYVLINADFKQLELRLGTAYSGDDNLKAVFNEGRDIFDEMAIDLEMSRPQTKQLVYLTQYGGGEGLVSRVFGVTQQRAREIRMNYFRTYPLFKALSDRCDSAVKQNKRVKLWTGRYRTFLSKQDGYKAMNSMIQGGAADIMERVMVRCFRELDNEDCLMLLQVHDSLTWEVKIEHVEYYMEKIREYMEDVETAVGHDQFDVHFGVDVEFWTEREKTKYEDWKLAE